MTVIALEAVAAANLIMVGSFANTSGFWNRLIFKFSPIALGSFLGSLAFARFMEWPI